MGDSAVNNRTAIKQQTIVLWQTPEGQLYRKPADKMGVSKLVIGLKRNNILYEVRNGGFCTKCNSDIVPKFKEPFASCGCGTQEWYV